MELFRAYQISTDYKDRRGGPNWDAIQFAEILFIDKTHHGKCPYPLVYQLKDRFLPLESALEFCKNHPTVFSREGFMHLGEELSIDRKKKLLTLGNNNIISYNHLVVISGTKPLLEFENEELVSALQALVDALRVKPKIPSSFANTTNLNSPYRPQNTPALDSHISVQETQSAQESHSRVSIDKVVQPNLVTNTPQDTTIELNALNKRLYEVQL